MFYTVIDRWRETEAALRQSEKLATAGQLAARLAHEMNNPMGVIKCYGELLRSRQRESAPPLFAHPAYGDRPPETTEPVLTDSGSAPRSGAKAGPADTPFGRLIGQYRESFILLEDDYGLAIVDQHVAHERVLYDQILARLGGETAPSQRLLTPILVEVGEAAASALDRVAAILLKVGVEADLFGHDTVRISALPPELDPAEAGEMVEEGTFREDLYHRLQVVEIALPPLRERTGDVPLLIDHFIERFNRRRGKRVQGISPEGRITTLGRGGSDTTAVAFAAAFGAERCDIYTDVDGVYTTDPRITSKARKLDRIAFEEMLELASLGAKVLQTRSVELAMRYKVKLRVLSSFEDNDEHAGTLVCAEEDIVESNVVAGVAFSRDEAKMTLQGVEDRPGIAAAIFGPLAEAGVKGLLQLNEAPHGFEAPLLLSNPGWMRPFEMFT